MNREDGERLKLRFLLRAVLCAGLIAAAPAAPAAAQSVWEMTPYRIRILVSFARAPELTPRLQADLLTDLADRADALVGAPWDITVAPLSTEKPPALTAAPSADSAAVVERGKAIFFSKETGCADCHPPPLYTDCGSPRAEGPPIRWHMEMPRRWEVRHEVGTRLPTDPEQQRLETPSLLGLRNFNAYLHHGEAKTLEAVLTEFNPQDKHGRTSHLSKEEVHALAEFLRRLGPLDLDKVIFLTVSPAAGGYRVTARELDVSTRLFSAAVSRPVWQLAKLRDVALGAVLDAFAPLARIERVEKKHRILALVAFPSEGHIHAPPNGRPGPKLTGDLRAGLIEHLAGQVEPLAEKDQDVTVAAAPPQLQDALRSSPAGVTLASFPKESLDYDEVIVLSVLPASSGFQVTTLGLHPLTQALSTPVTVPLSELAGLQATASGALSEAIGQIKRVRKTWVTLRLKAAALPFRDKELALVAHGTVFRPVIRYDDREGNLRRVMAVPWTFCTVWEVGPDLLVCRLHTGLRSPLSGRRRGRVQQLALAVVPPQESSVLMLQSRSDPKAPLAGYDVFAQPPHSKATVPLGRTDWRGRVTVPPAGKENPLRVLLVRNGGEPLAQLPMVPGMEPELIAQIANDDQRLEAEGFITGLQEQMVDLVTRREVLLIRTRARIEEAKFDEARDLIDELRRLPTSAEFALMLKEQQKKVRSADAKVQAKIDALFVDTQKLLRKHLDPDAIEEAWQELRKARSDTGS